MAKNKARLTRDSVAPKGPLELVLSDTEVELANAIEAVTQIGGDPALLTRLVEHVAKVLAQVNRGLARRAQRAERDAVAHKRKAARLAKLKEQLAKLEG